MPAKKEGGSRESKSNCDIAAECGSCKYVNSEYSKSLLVKHNKELENFSSLDLLQRWVRTSKPVGSDRVFSYRCTMKLAVRSDGGRFKVGLFKPGTHEVVPLERCPIHYPALSNFLNALTHYLNEDQSEILPWNEQTGEGDLRYVVARCAPLTEELQVVFVTTGVRKKPLFRSLVNTLKGQRIKISSAFLNINTSPGNSIFTDEFLKLSGQSHLRVQFNGFNFKISPASFVQVNPSVASSIYRRVMEVVGPTSTDKVAWDLYCGAGPLTFHLASLGFRVWAAEENPHAVADLRENIELNRVDEKRITVVAGKTEDCLGETENTWAAKPATILVNPSRRGLDARVRKTLGQMLANKGKLEQIIYVSCDARTMARDLQAMLEGGGRLRQLESFDMFPHTDKLEWMAVVTP